MNTCDKDAYSCRCALERNHEGPHVCLCQGSWFYDENGEFVVVRYPVDLADEED